MAFVVEDGTGLIGANSYASEDTLDAYADDFGITLGIGDAEAALRRATVYIDSYRARFPGIRTFARAQMLEWPRTGAYYNIENAGINDDYYQYGQSPYALLSPGYYIGPTTIPIEIVKATCEAAIREMASPGVMLPDIAFAGALKKITAGDTSKEYMSTGYIKPTPTYSAIDNLLSDLLTTVGSFGVAVRG